MKPKAEWAIDSEAMKARGIITSAEREVKGTKGFARLRNVSKLTFLIRLGT